MRAAAFLVALLLTACPPEPEREVAALPPPAAPESLAPAAPVHLRVAGTSFVDAAGKPFAWRGISAFRLVEMVAHGREHEAAAYLDWASANGLTVVRVLTMAHHLFTLAPAEGVAALPRLLEMAAARKLHVEVVALADSAAIDVNLEAHVRAVGEVAAAHGNTLIEIANEPVHPTQRAQVHEADIIAMLAATVPKTVPVSLGSVERGDGFAAGSYVTWHVPRTDEPAGWGHVLAIADGAELVQKWKKPVVSDEPIGAASVFVPGRRDNDVSRFRAGALLTRLAGLGATFHYEGGLHARIPRGRELECFKGWSEAWHLLPDDIERRGVFARAGEPDSAAAAYDRSAAAAVFERRDEKQAWVVAVGVTRDPDVQPAPGWRAGPAQQLPGLHLMTFLRE